MKYTIVGESTLGLNLEHHLNSKFPFFLMTRDYKVFWRPLNGSKGKRKRETLKYSEFFQLFLSGEFPLHSGAVDKSFESSI